MFELARRNNHHAVNGYNPFREMEDLERSFFGDPFFESRDLAEFKTDVTDEGDHYLLEADLDVYVSCPALTKRTSTWTSAATF